MLRSTLLRCDKRLQKCLISDPAHVVPGDCGPHVGLIQECLILLGYDQIRSDEMRSCTYGESTADQVLAFKQRNSIINYAYQNAADNIVGKMTIAAIDAHVFKSQVQKFSLMASVGLTAGAAGPGKVVIYSEPAQMAVTWAKQVQAAFGAGTVQLITAPRTGESANVSSLKSAINSASGGCLIVSVGHGWCYEDNRQNDVGAVTGAFDLSADGKMMVVGKNLKLDDSRVLAKEFYDDNVQKPYLNDKTRDQDSKSTDAKERLRKFDLYLDIANTFKKSNVAAVLLATCRVGNASEFLTHVASRWNTTIIAYKDKFSIIDVTKNGQPLRVRSCLARDMKLPGVRTNTVFGEVMFPLSFGDMVTFR